MEIKIPLTDPEVIAFWSAQAERHGHSLEEEIGILLSCNAATLQKKSNKKNEALKRLQDLRETIRKEHGNFPDITQMIREDRDSH